MKAWIKAMALALTVVWSAPSAAWWWDSTPSNYTDTRYPVVLVHGMFVWCGSGRAGLPTRR